jgi:hypothetical protein
MPRTRKRSEHYVNNKEFLNAIVIYRNQCKRAEEAGEDRPRIKNFDPEKSSNPFAYFTQIIHYAFLRRIQKEKRQMDIRAKIIERSGFEEVMSADGNFNASDYNTIKENIQAKQNS